MKCQERGLAVGETIMRISEVRNRERILLTTQGRENMARKEGGGMCFLTRTKKACHLLKSHYYPRLRLDERMLLGGKKHSLALMDTWGKPQGFRHYYTKSLA